MIVRTKHVIASGYSPRRTGTGAGGLVLCHCWRRMCVVRVLRVNVYVHVHLYLYACVRVCMCMHGYVPVWHCVDGRLCRYVGLLGNMQFDCSQF